MKLVDLTGAALEEALDDVARLRIAVFRDFPYLYDGDLEYERKYLQAYRASERALVVGAYDGDWLVGASTGAPLSEHADDFAEAFDGSGLPLETLFYCAESVLLPRFRRKGIGRMFFERREAHARAHGFTHMCFCAVVRPETHPQRPKDYRSLDEFWSGLGYQIMPDIQARFSWKDVGDKEETRKPLQFWIREF